MLDRTVYPSGRSQDICIVFTVNYGHRMRSSWMPSWNLSTRSDNKEEEMVRMEERYAMMETPVLLNEKPAIIRGARLPYAVIHQIRGDLAAEFSWDTVRRVIEATPPDRMPRFQV